MGTGQATRILPWLPKTSRSTRLNQAVFEISQFEVLRRFDVFSQDGAKRFDGERSNFGCKFEANVDDW